MYLAYRFSPVVDGYKKLVAYHAGDGVWTEVDVLLDGNEKVMRAHDVSETLQYCLEGLPEVDRAFVSVDCEYSLKMLSLEYVLITSNRYFSGAIGTRSEQPLIAAVLKAEMSRRLSDGRNPTWNNFNIV